MFQVGEIIVCIDNGVKDDYRLTTYKCYKVISYKGKPFDPNVVVHIINDVGESQSYHIKRFISLPEFRKMKINKICAK